MYICMYVCIYTYIYIYICIIYHILYVSIDRQTETVYKSGEQGPEH